MDEKRHEVHQAEAEQYRPSTNREEWLAEGWATTATPTTASRRLDTILSIRFDPDDSQLLRKASRLSGHTRSEFVRRAVINAAQAQIAQVKPARVVVNSITSEHSEIRTRSTARSNSEYPNPVRFGHSKVLVAG